MIILAGESFFIIIIFCTADLEFGTLSNQMKYDMYSIMKLSTFRGMCKSAWHILKALRKLQALNFIPLYWKAGEIPKGLAGNGIMRRVERKREKKKKTSKLNTCCFLAKERKQYKAIWECHNWTHKIKFFSESNLLYWQFPFLLLKISE